MHKMRKRGRRRGKWDEHGKRRQVLREEVEGGDGVTGYA